MSESEAVSRTDVSQWQRVLLALLLLGAVSGLFVHADITAEARQPYPGPNDLLADYDSYVGETVLLFGRVQAVRSDTFTIALDSTAGRLELRVNGEPPAVDPGGIVQVYGELRPDHTMAAERTVVVNDSTGSEWYKYGVSALGAIGFLVAFLRHWTVDTDRWVLEGRDG